MLKIVLLVALAITSTSAKFKPIISANTKDFLSGFANGLGAGHCSDSISTIISVGYKVLADLDIPNATIKDDITTLTDLQTLVNSFALLNTCDFATLYDQIKKIFSKGGLDILVTNYLNNGEILYSDFKTINMCQTNYTTCGEAAGNAFQLIVGWSLN